MRRQPRAPAGPPAPVCHRAALQHASGWGPAFPGSGSALSVVQGGRCLLGHLGAVTPVSRSRPSPPAPLPWPPGKDGGIDVTRLMELADDAEEEEAGGQPIHNYNQSSAA